MKPTTRIRVRVLLLLALLTGCQPQPAAVPETAELRALSDNFAPQLRTVAPGLHVAQGYGLANSILIEGDEGLIVVDTTESLEAAEQVLAAFRTVSKLPIKALIYTHNHADHIFGAAAFAGDDPLIFAHASLLDQAGRIVTELRPAISRRSLRMFGGALDDTEFSNSGIGPRLGINADSHFGLLPPNRTFDQRLRATVAGVEFELVHAPGETDDQILVWLPQFQALLPGDNLYRAFPNLYTIRGTAHRSLKQWAASIDLMREFPAEHLVPSHTAALSGRSEIQAVLRDYRDAIHYVHDQSIRWINQGLGPDEIVERVVLPPHLAASPWLQQVYGRVDWSVRAVFGGNLGWFDGNPTHLIPLPPSARAERFAALAGGQQALRQSLQQAVSAGDYQWALEISDWLLQLQPEAVAVRQLRQQALRALGAASNNPNARHYYLSAARELTAASSPPPSRNATPAMLAQLPMSNFFAALSVSLRAEDCLELEQKVGFSFPDSSENFSVWIRRGVAEIQPRLLPDLDIHVELDSLLWKQILARQKNAAVAIASAVHMKRGSRVELLRFLALFRNSGN